MGDVDTAVHALGRARRILAYTGAGCSTESGIPDFRGPDGLWTKVDPDDFTIDRFLSSPDVRIRSWQMHQRGELWCARSSISPNDAHLALTSLWSDGLLAGVVTQNIDGLHQAAGIPSDHVAELHGSVRTSRCVSCEARWPTEVVLGWLDEGVEDPRCPDCDGIVKTSTVMFGELLPDEEWDKATAMASEADAVLVVGSTMSVYPAVRIPLAVAAGGAPMVIVNLGPTDHDHLATVKVDAPAGATMQELADRLSGGDRTTTEP